MRIARDPKTGRFAKGGRGGPGRYPPPGETTKAERKHQQAVIAAWREQNASGVDLIAHMDAVLSGPTCAHCSKPLALSKWTARRAFCSTACANAAVFQRRRIDREHNARSKLKRGLKPGPTEQAALDGEPR